MLGTLRLLLAIAVALSHADVRIAGLNPGVIAVTGFYLVSGYVMAGLLQRHYPSPRHAGGFYLDRGLRLMPQYVFYLLLVLIWHFAAIAPVPAATQAYFLSRTPDAIDLLHNLAVIPLNYYMWNGADRYTLLPPAWSLGAEIQFYLLAPFILLWPRRLLAPGLLAIGVYLLAMFGQINSDWFGYRLLPGVLTYFLLGALLRHLHQQARDRAALALVVAIVLGSLAVGALARGHGSLTLPYNQETLLGLILIFPLLHLLARRRRQGWDEMAGNLSYGLFLNHFLLLWVLFPAGVPATQFPLYLIFGLLLAFFSHQYVERPVLALRKKLRRGGGG